MPILSLWTLALAIATPVQATPACPDGTAAVPTGWAAMTAGVDAKAPPALTIGHGVRATLSPTVRYAQAPAKPGEPGSFGGLFALTVAQAGRYRIALGAGAWIDVLAGDRPLQSVAHSHGPACSPLRKMVDFDLAPGRYLVQIAGAKATTLPLMVATVSR